MKIVLYLCDLPPQNLYTLTMGNITQTQIMGHFIKWLLSTPQKYQSLRKQGKSERLSQCLETWGDVMWYPDNVTLEQKKNIQENWQNPNTVWSLVVPLLLFYFILFF